jgi:hypothetical protein
LIGGVLLDEAARNKLFATVPDEKKRKSNESMSKKDL